MNFLRSRIFTNGLYGQRYRGMCNKLQETKSESTPAVPVQAPRAAFKVPGHRPSPMDVKMLVWSGRFKSVDQIPETVSSEMIDAARNKIRVKVSYFMMAFTIGACMLMIISGKRAAGKHDSLTAHNMEKKAKWREELLRENASAVAVSEKAQ